MIEALKKMRGRLVKLYTSSAVGSYIGTIEEVKGEYITIREAYSKELLYVSSHFIEAFKEVSG